MANSAATISPTIAGTVYFKIKQAFPQAELNPAVYAMARRIDDIDARIPVVRRRSFASALAPVPHAERTSHVQPISRPRCSGRIVR